MVRAERASATWYASPADPDRPHLLFRYLGGTNLLRWASASLNDTDDTIRYLNGNPFNAPFSTVDGNHGVYLGPCKSTPIEATAYPPSNESVFDPSSVRYCR